jgi:hypothetical protein
MIRLAVIHLALRDGEDHIVVGQHGAAGMFVIKELAIDSADSSLWVPKTSSDLGIFHN